tara:strand:- start:1477 stop:2055 length:579 start_codon:yes stop_codon:yes gene_type:complete
MEYQKYKWFFTNSGKLVVGGKSASQNDDLLKSLKGSGKEYWVMHTKEPGSPFCAIIAESQKVSKNDLEECAIFTGCFSRAWKQGKKKTDVDIFMLSQVRKGKGMKTGTWGVNGDIETKKIELRLALVKQKKVLRAVPEKSVKKKDILAKVAPGKIDKKEAVVGLALEINGESVSKNELLAALPAGGVRVLRK